MCPLGCSGRHCVSWDVVGIIVLPGVGLGGREEAGSSHHPTAWCSGDGNEGGGGGESATAIIQLLVQHIGGGRAGVVCIYMYKCIYTYNLCGRCATLLRVCGWGEGVYSVCIYIQLSVIVNIVQHVMIWMEQLFCILQQSRR